jgi:hypothetical protein
MVRKLRSTVVASVTCVALAGCLGYSFSGRVRVGDVYIPYFEDQSTGSRAINVGTNLTDRVVTEFRQDRHTHVFQGTAERAQAQKELLGTVKSVDETLLSRDVAEGGEEYRVVVVCSVTFRDLETDKTLWEGNVRGEGQYQLEEGDPGYQTALAKALDQIVRNIADNTLRAW